MTQPAYVLQTDMLCKRFHDFRAANNVCLNLKAGARHAVIGPNGAGKTTLVNLLTGQLAPTAGRVLLHGQDITATSPDERVRRGLVRTFQINQLLRRLSPLENVQMAVLERQGLGGSLLRRSGAQRQAAQEAFALLDSLNLGGDALKTVSELPYGKQRIVEIAIALALRPTVLLLDEPAAGVPPADSHRVLDLIDGLPVDMAVLIIEHDMGLVFRFARSVTVLVQGEVFLDDEASVIRNHEGVRQVYLGGAAHG